MSFSAAFLRAVLETHLPAAATGLVVAVSGGADSACLLTAVAQLCAGTDSGARAQSGSVAASEADAQSGAGAESGGAEWGARRLHSLSVRAVHVDHGLQPAAAEFRQACEELCRRLHIPLTVIAVAVDLEGGVSIEAAARDARYQGMSRQLKGGECLLTAHHAMDQAETVLLQMLRGAGLKGLSAMPIRRRLGQGWHLRPLLGVAQRDLLKFGEDWGVIAVRDPMNRDMRFDRAYLRTRLWPLIEERWPGAAMALSRTARHVADAQELLDQSAALAVQQLRDGNALSVTGLRPLSASEQLNALRYWIAAHAIAPPSTARLAEALRQIMEADRDHLPAIVWGEHALRRYRERLFLTEALPPGLKGCREWMITSVSSMDLGPGLGRLRRSPQIGGLDADRLPNTLSVRPRQGGETLKPHRHSRTQSVQHLCQSLGVLPWMRDALPLVYAGDALIAVGDLWQDARWCAAAGAPGFGFDWDDAPIIV